MTQATITIEDLSADTKIAHMQGQLDESNIDEKIKEVYSAIEKVSKGLKLIFDFSNLDYMNSKSIGYLTDIYGKVTEGGGRVMIAAAKPNITDILQVVGLTQIIENFATLDEAKEKMETPVQATSPAPSDAPAKAPAAASPVQPQPQIPVSAPATAPTTAPAQTPTSSSAKTPEPTAMPTPNPQPGATSVTTPLTAVLSQSSVPAAPAPSAPTNNEEGTYTFEKQ